MILVGIRNVRKYYIRSYKLTLEADMKQAKVLTEKELKKVVDYINGMEWIDTQYVTEQCYY